MKSGGKPALIRAWTLYRVLWRLGFLQASWNDEGQQSLGAASAMWPALEKIYESSEDELQSAVLRHLETFNTNPFMSGVVLGALIKAEEIRSEGGLNDDRYQRYRRGLSAAFAAVGDAFFWNAYLPVTSMLGLFLALTGRLMGVVLFLATFNLVHLAARVGGLCMGYRQGLNVARTVDRLKLPVVALRLRILMAGALGGWGAWSLWIAWGRPPDTRFVLLGLLAPILVFVVIILLRSRVPIEGVAYGLLVIMTIGCHFWGCG